MISEKEILAFRFSRLALSVNVIEELPDAILLVDTSGVIQLANRRAAEMFGYSRLELFDSSVAILIPPDVREKHAEQVKHFFTAPHGRSMGSDGEHGEALSLIGAHKDGTEISVVIGLSPILAAGNVLVLAVIVKKRNADENLADSIKRIAERTAKRISHTGSKAA